MGGNEHIALFLDQTGGHGAKVLNIPDAVTLEPLPPSSPELKPAERVWLYLRERDLSHRLLLDYHVVVEATCEAGRRPIAQDGRMTSLASH